MKKILSIVLSLAMVCAMCISMSMTAFAATGTGTKADPYVVSDWAEFKSVCDSTPTDNLTGATTFIRLDGNLVYADNFKITSGRNIDLDLNGHTVNIYGFSVTGIKFTVYNGTLKSPDKATSTYAAPALTVSDNSVLNANNVSFYGGNATTSGVSGGYGLFVLNSTFVVQNCSINAGNSYSDAPKATALYASDSTGTIFGATLTMGTGTQHWAYPALRLDNTCKVTDGDGNTLASSDYTVNQIIIPAATGANSEITAVGGSKSAEVKGTYQAGSAADTVYSVEVAWGSMDFTYTDASKGTWNPLTHEYENAQTAGWSCGTDENKITVTNRSNAAIDAGLTYTNADGLNLTTEFTSTDNAPITKLSLPTAEAYDETLSGPRTAAAYMNITSGAISSGTKTTLGTITVTISDAE